ncbi:hypothetical protein PUV44_24025 [Xanthomonas arboricola pv. corylina]|nr:hypothetical protein PUV44_24025 [Xanthomonas arboricola pv. corylina]
MVSLMSGCEFQGIARKRFVLLLRSLKHSTRFSDFSFHLGLIAIKLLGEARDPRELSLSEVMLAF